MTTAADHAGPAELATAGQAGAAVARPIGSARLRRRKDPTRSLRTAIVCALFLVLLGAASLVGPTALFRPGMGGRAINVGEVVYRSPDGALCRHLAFDNTTAELTEGAMEQCAGRPALVRPPRISSFAWGAH